MEVNISECVDLGPMTRQQSEADVMDVRLVFLLYAFPVLTGCAGNVCLLCFVACSSQVKSKPTLFLMSIAVADLILSVVCGIYHIDKYYRFLHPNTAVGHLLCQMTSYAELTVQIVVVFSLLGVSAERFVVVCFPLRAKHIWTRPRCRVAIVLVWVSAMLIGLIEPLTKQAVCLRHTITDENNREQLDFVCSYKEAGQREVITWIRLCILFAIPFAAMIGFYGAVIYRLWKSTDSDLSAANIGCRRFARHASELPLPPRRTSSSVTSTSVSTKRQMSETFFFQRSAKHRHVSTGGVSAISTASILSFASSLLSMVSPARSTSSDTLSNINEATSSNAFVTPAIEFVARRQMAMEVKRSRKRVMKMLLLVVALFACSWSPKLIIDMIMARAVTDVEEDPPFDKMNFTQHQWPMGNSTPQMAFGPFGNGSSEGMFNYEDEQTRLEQARAYAISLMLFHSTFNPIVYIAFSSDFRAALCQRRRRMRI